MSMNGTAQRIPPHNLDAEAAVLSAVLLYREALDAAAERLKPEHFYSTANGMIFEAALAVAASGKPVDLTTVANYLRTAERLGEVDDLPGHGDVGRTRGRVAGGVVVHQHDRRRRQFQRPHDTSRRSSR